MTDHTPDSRTVGEHFLEFIISFFNLAKGRYQQQNQIKANSVAFHALVVLNQPGRPAPTMSELASELEITKQQLTKLVNDLEEKQLVERQHDHRNRRQYHQTGNADHHSHRRQDRAAVKGSHAQLHHGRAFRLYQGGAV